MGASVLHARFGIFAGGFPAPLPSMKTFGYHTGFSFLPHVISALAYYIPSYTVLYYTPFGFQLQLICGWPPHPLPAKKIYCHVSYLYYFAHARWALALHMPCYTLSVYQYYQVTGLSALVHLRVASPPLTCQANFMSPHGLFYRCARALWSLELYMPTYTLPVLPLTKSTDCCADEGGSAAVRCMPPGQCFFFYIVQPAPFSIHRQRPSSSLSDVILLFNAIH